MISPEDPRRLQRGCSPLLPPMEEAFQWGGASDRSRPHQSFSSDLIPGDLFRYSPLTQLHVNQAR